MNFFLELLNKFFTPEATNRPVQNKIAVPTDDATNWDLPKPPPVFAASPAEPMTVSEQEAIRTIERKSNQ